MITEQANLWRVVSRGYAAHNLELDSKILEVFCPEISGFADGEITTDTKDHQTQGVDDTGNNYTVKITTANTIKCQWRQSGSNRITPPNVRRGERVEVWQYADADKYYWSTTGEDDHLRRRETVTHAYSNTTDESTKELNKDNSYWHQVDTHNKVVTLIGTSNSDGEPLTHLLQLNTKTGIFNYSDSNGNYIQVEGVDNIITIENSDGSKAVLDKTNGTISVPNTLDITCKTLNIKAQSINTNASSISETAGSKTIKANISTNGTLTNNGTNISSTHTHGGISSGPSSTSTPN